MSATSLTESAPDPGQHLLLYDGVCGLCNRLTRFILPRDPEGVFRFAALQSDLGRQILEAHGLDPDALDTFYIVADYASDQPRLVAKARAAMLVVRIVGWPWKLAMVFRVLPWRVLNWGYDRIARNRYRMFGRLETCPMPTPETRARFLDAG